MNVDVLTLKDARRIALAAQGFDRPRPRRAGARELARTIRQLGLLQIDYVNVLVPSQYLVPFSRLGPYDRVLLDEAIYRRREFIEQWAHEASILPIECWPLLGYRREAQKLRLWGFPRLLEKHAGYVDAVLEAVRAGGPLTAGELPCPDGIPRRAPGAWHSVPRAALEALFERGVLAVADRRPNFARAFDLAARLIPAEHYGRRVEREEAERELLRRAARAHGLGTAADLADYYRMPVRDARPRIAELVEAGELVVVRVEGWREPAYLDREAPAPRDLTRAALLSPFDPVVWFRPRAARLFAFDYRLEIWVPEAKRRWGYYVLPFLMGDRLAARVDVKADRETRRLLVPAAYLEAGAPAGETAGALAGELRTLARWMGLDEVRIAGRGGFARKLAAATRQVTARS
ncbi:MAG: winged helix-turn-helix domain-containing protein [Acidobacteriota bacterium]